MTALDTHRVRILFSLLAALALLLLLGGAVTPALAQSGSSDEVEIIMFWGDGCPHCAEADPFLEGLADQYDYVKLTKYEVWYNKPNQALYQQMADQYQVPATGRGVPFILVGDRYWMGYSAQIGQEIEAAVKERGAALPPVSEDVINVPLFGKIDLAHQPLFVSTLLIGFVDGVNPCSVWVLTMLLALTLHTGSRKKMVIIGLVFLTVTAAIYGLFIAGLVTIFSFASVLPWIQAVVALVALLFGLVNIKDYFWYKEGLSFTINDAQKPGIFRRMRALMDTSQSFGGLVGGTVVMAAGVSLVEFSCTAGFPVLWANMLVAQSVPALTFALLLLVYLLIYQLDELAIFFTAVYTMKASRLEEKHGRILKLIGGVLMLTLSAVMLINPQMMNTISSSLLIFAIAAAIILVVLVLHRRILPHYGIWIGSELEGRRKKGRRKVNRA